jgi:hypothetical protein
MSLSLTSGMPLRGISIHLLFSLTAVVAMNGDDRCDVSSKIATREAADVIVGKPTAIFRMDIPETVAVKLMRLVQHVDDVKKRGRLLVFVAPDVATLTVRSPQGDNSGGTGGQHLKVPGLFPVDSDVADAKLGSFEYSAAGSLRWFCEVLGLRLRETPDGFLVSRE